MEWVKNNLVVILSVFFGAGSIGYSMVSRFLYKRKYEQEVRSVSADVDIKSDEFWKKRYEVLENENKGRDEWWKQRYDNLYCEFQSERNLSNEIVKSFRSELNEIRHEYESQRENDKNRYNKLYDEYKLLEDESNKKATQQLGRISQLETIVIEYENRLKRNLQ